MWEFAVGLFMIQVWPTSLLLAAVYGLTESASIALFGVSIGKWVDRNPRLKVCASLSASHAQFVPFTTLHILLKLLHSDRSAEFPPLRFSDSKHSDCAGGSSVTGCAEWLHHRRRSCSGGLVGVSGVSTAWRVESLRHSGCDGERVWLSCRSRWPCEQPRGGTRLVGLHSPPSRNLTLFAPWTTSSSAQAPWDW